MRPSSLSLEHYFIKSMRFALRDGFDRKSPLEEIITTPRFEVKAEFVKPKDNPHQCRCELEIDLPDDPADKFPYTFGVTLVGDFRVSEKMPPEQADQLFRINGTSVLYSMAREVVIWLTGRGGYASFLLPTASFVDAFDDKSKVEKPASKATTSKTRKKAAKGKSRRSTASK